MSTYGVVFGYKYINGRYKVTATNSAGWLIMFGTVWQGETGKWFGSLSSSRTADVMGNTFVDCRNNLWALMNGG